MDNQLLQKRLYYKAKDFQLFCGDSLKILISFPDETFDMIFADPPYMLSNGGFSVHSGKRVSVNKGSWDKSAGFDSDLEFHLQWIQECRRILKPNGTLWVSGTYHSIYQCGYALQKLNFSILNDIAWFKPNAAPNLSCRFFTASHETLIWAKKDSKAKHTFNYNEIKNNPWLGDILKKPNLQMRSVWSITPPKPAEKIYGKHPTQKPLELLKRIIIASTVPEDLILDPFNGSGTTGIMANLLERKYIGIDVNKEYLDLTIKRHQDLGS